MSYDINLLDPVSKTVIELDVPHFMCGGTYQLGGCSELSFNITYNYSKYFYQLVDSEQGIRVIYGMTGLESIPILENAIRQLGDDVEEDYWKATEGNAKRALISLVTMAKMRPDGIWEGD